MLLFCFISFTGNTLAGPLYYKEIFVLNLKEIR
jgi:hypothetical protein